MMPKETLGLLFTNIAQLMSYPVIVCVAGYHAVVLPNLLAEVYQ